ncbi:MAG: DUF2273 domain-containing protein [Anaerovibrio sp.]|uniref:DUF2273 domain-containing protein n=1 Tax=Anaerovibrio sp. TaxID=1872532 RepID=UPI0025D5CBC2|nr:DUF2273 domain-containing protein [Anaerovibrio sp.]MCR5175849.1 DUF2273 domain-containing protein [Anaerovibrio sp.]
MDNDKTLKKALADGLRRQCEKRPGTLLGIMCGVIIAVGILLVGFWSVFFIAVCAAVGCFIGKNIDKGGSLIDNIRDSIPSNLHRWH